MTEQFSPTDAQVIKLASAPYKELNPNSYRVFLRHMNIEYLEATNERLRLAPVGQNQCLIVVGSDGKQERHKQSKTDLVLVSIHGADGLDAQGLKHWYNEAFPVARFEEDFDLPYDQLPQSTELGDPDNLASYAYAHLYRRPARIYPDRILNAKVVAGNEEVYVQARKQVLVEMTNDAKKSRQIRHEMLHQLRHYLQSCTSGEYRGMPVYSLDGEVQIYDEDPAQYRTGFKIPFLRVVQRYLDIATTIAIRTGTLDLADAVNELPTATADRIDYLRKKKILPADQTTFAFRRAYLWFIQQYHFAQEMYKATREPVALRFDPEKLLVHRAAIIDYTKDVHYPDLH